MQPFLADRGSVRFHPACHSLDNTKSWRRKIVFFFGNRRIVRPCVSQAYKKLDMISYMPKDGLTKIVTTAA